MSITVDTTRAEKAKISLRGMTGRSYFARAEGETEARFKVWTDYAYGDTIKAVKTGARKFLKKRDIVIEVGPPGRRV